MKPAKPQPYRWVVAAGLLVAGCPDAIRGAPNDHEGAPDGAVADLGDSGPGLDASLPSAASDAGADASTRPDASVPNTNVDRAWAAWPLPPPSPPTSNYSITANTTTDETTKLIWEKQVSAQGYTWQAAKDYCDTLTLEGQADWRLPTRIELWSIVDFGTHSPSINRVGFPSTPTELFWSASLDAQNPGYRGWVVSFENGSSGPLPKDNAYRVRCVRGG